MFLDFNEQRSYDSYETLELFAKNQVDLLQSFQKCYTNSFKALLNCKTSIKTLHDSKLQLISLIRDLFEFFNDIVNCQQHAFDQEYTINDNFNLYKTLIDVINTKRFENFDSKKMYNVLLKFKVFLDIDTLNTMRWRMQMMKFLFIDFSKRYMILYREWRVQLLLTLIETSLLDVERIQLKRDKSRLHILVILSFVNAKKQH